ncbi:MAG: hypothetical protein ACRYGK_15250 [Janthinobacterium lividum]
MMDPTRIYSRSLSFSFDSPPPANTTGRAAPYQIRTRAMNPATALPVPVLETNTEIETGEALIRRVQTALDPNAPATQTQQRLRSSLLRLRSVLCTAITAQTLDMRCERRVRDSLDLPGTLVAQCHALADRAQLAIRCCILDKHLQALPEGLPAEGMEHLVIPDYAGRQIDLRALVARQGRQARVLLLNPACLETIHADASLVINIVGADQSQILRAAPRQAGAAGDAEADQPAVNRQTTPALALFRLGRQAPASAKVFSTWLQANSHHAFITTANGWRLAVADIFQSMQAANLSSLAAQLLSRTSEMALEFAILPDAGSDGGTWFHIHWSVDTQAGMLKTSSLEQMVQHSLLMMLGKHAFIEHFETGDGLCTINIWPHDTARLAEQVLATGMAPALTLADRNIVLLPPGDVLSNPDLLETLVRADMVDAVAAFWDNGGMSDIAKCNLLLGTGAGAPTPLQLALALDQPDMLVCLINTVDGLELAEHIKLEILWAGREQEGRMVCAFEQACGHRDFHMALVYLNAIHACDISDDGKKMLMRGTVLPDSRPAVTELLCSGHVNGLANAALAIQAAYLPLLWRMELLASLDLQAAGADASVAAERACAALLFDVITTAQQQPPHREQSLFA